MHRRRRVRGCPRSVVRGRRGGSFGVLGVEWCADVAVRVLLDVPDGPVAVAVDVLAVVDYPGWHVLAWGANVSALCISGHGFSFQQHPSQPWMPVSGHENSRPGSRTAAGFTRLGKRSKRFLRGC